MKYIKNSRPSKYIPDIKRTYNNENDQLKKCHYNIDNKTNNE